MSISITVDLKRGLQVLQDDFTIAAAVELKVPGNVQIYITSLNYSQNLVTQVLYFCCTIFWIIPYVNILIKGSDGTQITLSQSDKWLRQAKVIDGWSVTTTDTAIAFR